MRKFCRIVFSRYAVSAVFILADIALLLLIGIKLAEYSILFTVLFAVIDALVILSLINRDVNPEYKVSWLVIVMLLPGFGALLYVLFYSRRLSRREAASMRKILGSLAHAAEEGDGALSGLSELAAESAAAAGQAEAIMRDDPLAEVYTGTCAEYFSSGEKLYERLLRDVAEAERYIFLEYFIVSPGEMWDGIHSLLKEKVKAGVDVRMLYDDVGCMASLPFDFDKHLRAEGISCYRFSKVTPRLGAVHNNRDHRKIAIIDGEVAYTGGINIADEYINKKMRFGHWKDGGVRIFGDAVRGFVKLFLSSYDLTAADTSDYSYFLEYRDVASLQTIAPCASDTHHPVSEFSGFYIPFGCGPMPIYKSSVAKSAIVGIINRAERYVYITTPYLIIDFDLTEALRGAAKRGVDVRIITPRVPDKKTVKIMTKSSYPYLTAAGVRIFEYAPGFIHEKTLVCDDEYAIVGTINMDYRSLVHHFECGVWIYGAPVIEKIREGVADTLALCCEIDKRAAELTLSERITRALVRIFAPLL